MKIKRTVNVKDENGCTITSDIEIELTEKELGDAHEEHVTNFMQRVLEDDFGYEKEVAEELAVDAYAEYSEGNGLTEYECIEKVVDEYEEASNDE